MRRSLCFSFFFHSPTWSTPFSISSLKVNHSLEQLSFQKPIKTVDCLSHCLSLRSFSSFNSRHRRPYRGRLIKNPSQYGPQTNNTAGMRVVQYYNNSFYSAVSKGDMKRVLELVEELKGRKLSIETRSLKGTAHSLIKKEQRTFVKELFRQTEGKDPSLELLFLLLFYTNQIGDYTLVDQVLLRMHRSTELLHMNEKRLSGMFHQIRSSSFTECFTSFRTLLIFLCTRTGLSFTRSFWHFFEGLGELLL